jgi:hypothetical protein
MRAATPVELAVLALLQGRLREFKTFECGYRQCLFVGDKLSKGFRVEELPALQIEEGLTPERSRPMNLGEIRHLVPVSVMLVMTSLDLGDLRQSMLALQRRAHETLNRGRKSGVLGTGLWVTGDMVASNSIVQEERFFGLATIQVEITKVVEIA